MQGIIKEVKAANNGAYSVTIDAGGRATNMFCFKEDAEKFGVAGLSTGTPVSFEYQSQQKKSGNGTYNKLVAIAQMQATQSGGQTPSVASTTHTGGNDNPATVGRVLFVREIVAAAVRAGHSVDEMVLYGRKALEIFDGITGRAKAAPPPPPPPAAKPDFDDEIPF